MLREHPVRYPAFQIKFPNLLLLRQINLRTLSKGADLEVEIEINFP